jgi:hypothetical protein
MPYLITDSRISIHFSIDFSEPGIVESVVKVNGKPFVAGIRISIIHTFPENSREKSLKKSFLTEPTIAADLSIIRIPPPLLDNHWNKNSADQEYNRGEMIKGSESSITAARE